MLNFTFSNTTKIHFGQGKINEISSEISINARVLVTCGGGSIKNNGIFEQVATALQGHQWFEFSGIEPNPSYETWSMLTWVSRLLMVCWHS